MIIGACFGAVPGLGGFFLGIFEGFGSIGTWSISSLTRLGMAAAEMAKMVRTCSSLIQTLDLSECQEMPSLRIAEL